MSKKVIAIDVDEVLFPFTPTFMDYHNAAYKTQFLPEHKKSDFLEEVTGETEAEMCAKIDAYLKTHHYREGRPILGAVEAIRRISRQYKLVVITARTQNYLGSTEDFVERHFPGMFDGIHYTFDVANPTKAVTKGVLCQKVGAHILIDDSIRNLSTLTGTNVQGILFGNYSWNQIAELPDHVTRCVDWTAVEKYLGTAHAKPARRTAATAQLAAAV